MELLKDIMMNIYQNMYSYTCYVIIGIVLYIIINFLVWKLNFNVAVLKVVVTLLALFLPICSCISITFLLYKRIIKDEKFVLVIYLISIFFNISGFLFIYMYFGSIVFSIYVLVLALILIIVYKVLSIVEKSKNRPSKCNDEMYKSISNLYYISNFVFIHFVSLVIMSFINAVFINVQYIDVAGTNINLPIFIFNNIVLNYFCIPNDILKMSQYMYIGYSVSLIIPVIYIATIMNLPDFLLIITQFKCKLFYFIATLLTSIVIGIVFCIFDSNDMISKTSIDYDDNLFKWASVLNINPSNYIRITSIIIYILLLLYYSQKKRRVKVMKSRVLSICLVLSMSLMLFSCGDSSSQNAIKQDTASVNPLAKTPYSDGPDTIENIVKKLVANYNLPELSEADKNYEINMGYYNCDHMTAGPIGEFAGIYKALGMNVKLTGNANVPAAMQAGQMDIAYCGWTTTLSAVQKGVPLFIAAENHIGGAEYLVVRKGIDMSNPENLYGKSVSFGTDPETTNLNWAEWTTKLGLDRDSSKYEGVAMKDAEEYTAMKAGHLDAYICCDPWGTMAQYSNGKDIDSVGNIIIRQDTDRTKDGLGHGTCCKVAMNYNFAKEHPRLAERLLLAHTITLQFCYEHPYFASLGFSAYYNVPVKVALENFWRKFVNEGRTLRWDLNVDYMRNQLNTMKHYGIRDDINTVNVEDYVDLQYFNNSGAIDFEDFIKKNIDPVFPETQDWETYNKVALAIDGINESDIPEYVTLDDLKLIK